MTTALMAVTIDVEQDCDAEWMVKDPLAFESVRVGLTERLQPLCKRFGVRPTYLLSPSILQDDDSVEAMACLGEAGELGAHLHGEFVEPLRTLPGRSGTATSDLQCLYPEDVEKGKLASLTRLFEDRFGFRPTSFRAGRFAASARTTHALIKLGYLVDSSVTPHVAWRHEQAIIDHSSAPDQPYHPDADDLTRIGSLPILEVPVTIWPAGYWGGRLSFARWTSFPHGVVGRYVGRPLWLRPSFHSARDMCRVVDWVLDRNKGQSLAVLNLMFHSVELTARTSPYAETEQDARDLLDRLSMVFEHVRKRGCVFATLNEVREAVARSSAG